ncbi:hypothetical protein HDV01_002579 [Terramyces sp. JEL0728]|nr:hypothetical protein HDV01_002579 [Terramyces sp. JEL0728]
MADTKNDRVHNAVHDDAIWRQTIRYESNTASNWQKNWGFMQQAMIENQKIAQKEDSRKVSHRPTLPAITSNDGRVTGLPSILPPGLDDEGNGIVSDWMYTSNIPRIIKYRFPSEKYKTPTTTSHEIGWPWQKEPIKPIKKPGVSISYNRAAIPQADSLEVYGKHARGQGDVLKWFGAREALP